MRALGTTFCIGLLLVLQGNRPLLRPCAIYATNSGGDAVNVIDPVTNKTVATLDGVEGAHGVAASPDGSRVYVSNEADSTLDVFDQKTSKLIKKIPLSGHPNTSRSPRMGVSLWPSPVIRARSTLSIP